jgi:hypothetical protein
MLPNIKGKHVHFNLIPNIIYENEDIAEDLRKSRQSDFMQRKADAIRFERLLSPILSLQHRTKIWNRLYNT